jgi:hypothetical protein
MSLDVETENLSRPSLRLFGSLRDLYAARLAAAAGLDLSLDDHHGCTDCGGGLFGLGRGGCRDAAQHRNPIALEEVSRLVLVQIHTCLHARVRSDRPDAWRKTRSRAYHQADDPKPIRDQHDACGEGKLIIFRRSSARIASIEFLRRH